MANTKKDPRPRPSNSRLVARGARERLVARSNDAPAHLDAAQRDLVEEAVRLGADLSDELEARVTSYGRWLLESIFDHDTGAALDERSKNPVWLELLRRAGGPTLPLSKRALHVALRLAAYDKRITDQSWRGLDAGRKELLLPLREDQRVRRAAQHVSRFNLTQAKTIAYVGELMAEAGQPKSVRLTAPMIIGRMKRIQKTLGGAATLKRLRTLHDLAPEERVAVAGEIDKVRELLSAIAREVRGR